MKRRTQILLVTFGVVLLVSSVGEAGIFGRRRVQQRQVPRQQQQQPQKQSEPVSIRKVESQNGQVVSVEYRTTPIAGGGYQTERRVYAIQNTAGGWNYTQPTQTHAPKETVELPAPVVKLPTPVVKSPTSTVSAIEPGTTAVASGNAQAGFDRLSAQAGARASTIQREVERQVTQGVKNDILRGTDNVEGLAQRVAQGLINRQPGGGVVPLDTLVARAGLNQASHEGAFQLTDKRNITGVQEKKGAPTLVVRVDPTGDPEQTRRVMDRFDKKFRQQVVSKELGNLQGTGASALSSVGKMFAGLMVPTAVTNEMLRATGLAAPRGLGDSFSAMNSDLGNLGSAMGHAVRAQEANQINVLTTLDTAKVLAKGYEAYRKPITGEQSYRSRVQQYYAEKQINDQERAKLAKLGLSEKEIDQRLPRPIIPSPSAAEVVGVKAGDKAPKIAFGLASRPGIFGRAARSKITDQVTSEAAGQLTHATNQAATIASASMAKEMFSAYAKVAEAYKSLPDGVSASVGLVTRPEASEALKQAVGEGNVAMRIPVTIDGKDSQIWLPLPNDGDPNIDEKLDRIARLTALLAQAASKKGDVLTKAEADKVIQDENDRPTAKAPEALPAPEPRKTARRGATEELPALRKAPKPTHQSP